MISIAKITYKNVCELKNSYICNVKRVSTSATHRDNPIQTNTQMKNIGHISEGLFSPFYYYFYFQKRWAACSVCK